MSLTDALALFIYALLLCDAIAIVAAVVFAAITIVFEFMSSSPSHGYAMLKDMATISVHSLPSRSRCPSWCSCWWRRCTCLAAVCSTWSARLCDVKGGMLMNIWIIAGVFVIGIAVGAGLVWGYMDYQWRTNPYRLKTIVDGVIAYRERKMEKKL